MTSEDLHRSQFRLPAELADQLKAAAEANGRSLNAEIVHRLQQSVAQTEEYWVSLVERGCLQALAKRR